MKTKVFYNTIEIGDIVCLHLQRSFTIPQTMTDKLQLYRSWAGFNYGIVNDILSRKADGKPRTVSLFLYYQQPNGVWLMYSLKHGIPTFVDFHTSQIVLVHKSSAPDYGSGNVRS